MPVRSIRQLPRHNSDDSNLVHKVEYTSNRGFNGTDYHTYCGLDLTSGEKWSPPQYDFITCVACVSTPKRCATCRLPLRGSQLPTDTPERCYRCAT